MSRPERVDDSIKGNALKKIQKDKIQKILAEIKEKSTEEKIVAVREYLTSKNLPYKGVAQETAMERQRIVVHFSGTSYYFSL